VYTVYTGYENDRPPIIGTMGRDSGPVRLRVAPHTAGKTLKRPGAQFTRPRAGANTDEWPGYHQIERKRVTVNPGEHAWARDDDGDGIREVQIHTTAGLWTGPRNFLRPFRGVQKKHLAGDVAICEHSLNLKRITPHFIAALVRCP
jgi:hypothetical protein